MRSWAFSAAASREAASLSRCANRTFQGRRSAAAARPPPSSTGVQVCGGGRAANSGRGRSDRVGGSGSGAGGLGGRVGGRAVGRAKGTGADSGGGGRWRWTQEWHQADAVDGAVGWRRRCERAREGRWSRGDHEERQTAVPLGAPLRAVWASGRAGGGRRATHDHVDRRVDRRALAGRTGTGNGVDHPKAEAERAVATA